MISVEYVLAFGGPQALILPAPFIQLDNSAVTWPPCDPVTSQCDAAGTCSVGQALVLEEQPLCQNTAEPLLAQDGSSWLLDSDGGGCQVKCIS